MWVYLCVRCGWLGARGWSYNLSTHPTARLCLLLKRSASKAQSQPSRQSHCLCFCLKYLVMSIRKLLFYLILFFKSIGTYQLLEARAQSSDPFSQAQGLPSKSSSLHHHHRLHLHTYCTTDHVELTDSRQSHMIHSPKLRPMLMHNCS
ncbi:hypothetical protein CROQUDRAFT_369973 [Cronartium quercuum f. sp. fusiforme G11]|uniref:Uncharacterized protein n=1 Tax=Cronartium quercuum f. sp. fusiforme G11 TaxID=708437 RepID=A0A9P6TDX2_9BASI|nr:hypothetical protein CROQUDRAFT_369973 [Cronartium quercuum f. sp. fusiforme G11]